jgi:hypothetical protein
MKQKRDKISNVLKGIEYKYVVLATEKKSMMFDNIKDGYLKYQVTKPPCSLTIYGQHSTCTLKRADK